LNAACSGFVYALITGTQFIAMGTYQHALVIGADTLSRWLDFTDRTTCVLFGDGAGAVVLSASDEPGGLLLFILGADGSGGKHLYVPSGGFKRPPTAPSKPAVAGSYRISLR
jgi:3-oxoacyl-[acyl-carrier-protein] synthase-3